MGQVELDPTVDFVAGTAAGINSLIVGFPLDTVKVRFQNPQTAIKYRSTVHAASTIIREEKFLGLFKGITSPLAFSALLGGLVFSSYRFFLKLQLEDNDDKPTLTQITFAGSGAGIISSLLTSPIELIKIRQQTSVQKSLSVYSTALQVIKTSGFSGMYRGITATALRDTRYGAYFLAYEATCRALPSPTPTRHSEGANSRASAYWSTLLIAGGIAGVFGWVVTFPFDVIKTRIQSTESSDLRSSRLSPTQSRSTLPPSMPSTLNAVDTNPYRNTVSTIVHSYRKEGPSVFFRGLSPTLLRAIPVNMVTFVTFEAVVHALA